MRRFVDIKHRIQEKIVTVPKKPFFLVIPYLGLLSLQSWTKLRKSLIDILICCKLLIMFCYFVAILNLNFDRLSALTPGKIFLLELKKSLNGK